MNAEMVPHRSRVGGTGEGSRQDDARHDEEPTPVGVARPHHAASLGASHLPSQPACQRSKALVLHREVEASARRPLVAFPDPRALIDRWPTDDARTCHAPRRERSPLTGQGFERMFQRCRQIVARRMLNGSTPSVDMPIVHFSITRPRSCTRTTTEIGLQSVSDPVS